MSTNQNDDRTRRIAASIADDLKAGENQVLAAMALLADGATVPFIARYRKEATDGLDDTQLRTLEERLIYLQDLEDRRETVLANVEQQGKLTPELAREIRSADTKTRLEDLYLPYKPKRKTKGQTAIQAGLEPLALSLWRKPGGEPESRAASFVAAERGIPDSKAALEGAAAILAERFCEDADLLNGLRTKLRREAFLRSKLISGKEAEGAKFRDYFQYCERLNGIPSHRVLALLRGAREGVLRLELVPDRDHLEKVPSPSPLESRIASHLNIRVDVSSCGAWLGKVVHTTWIQKLKPKFQNEFLSDLRQAAEEEAIKVFARNLKDLLLAAPAGPKATLGLDPGLRTGVKLAVVDGTGKLLATETIYPHPPHNRRREALRTLRDLCGRHRVSLIAIGNGTASRETDQLVSELIAELPGIEKVMVSEAGASVYSASELAALEFPNLDVSLRGAVSIARRLQDPLAELVKIDPKSIGVGQYQHDVNQTALAGGLERVVEDCVNAVGVDVNTASVPLLARVSGLSRTLASNIVSWREENGRFGQRIQLKKVPRMGAKSYEQSAGFLRILDGSQPLDASAVHPEAYPVAKRIATAAGTDLKVLIGNNSLLKGLQAKDFTDARFGLPTVVDIIAELEKPGRDPRGAFTTATFREDVVTMADLQVGMVLEGVVSNVTNFGAFVDIGVHQDGLVHISALANRFISDPRTVVRAGDIVTVKVTAVDIPRKRISLSMKDLGK